MQTTPNRFGINMTHFIKEHEAYLLSQIQALDDPRTQPTPPDLAALIAYHTQIIQWVQHERLIHLIVTGLAVLLLMFAFVLVLLLDASLLSLVLLAIAFVLVTAYTIHYFQLENTIQRWYTYGTVLMKRNLEGKYQP